MLQRPLSVILPISEMEAILETFPELYTQHYHQHMLYKLGFESLSFPETEALIDLTLQLLFFTKVGYSQFFCTLKQKFSLQWHQDPKSILQDLECLGLGTKVAILKHWCWFYHQLLLKRSPRAIHTIHGSTPATSKSHICPPRIRNRENLATYWK